MNLSQMLVSVLLAMILVCVCWIPSIIADCTTQAQIPQVECDALVDLYTSTNGAGWTDSTGWNADDFPCSWYGVTCSDAHVTRLYLGINNLAGIIPSSISNLTSLEYLYLHVNQLTGNIPAALGNLSSLNRLYLNNNQFTGTIPSEFGNLNSLQIMELPNNQLTGSIPSAIGNLDSLQILYLPNNQLTGNIPAALGNLSSLNKLYLNNNQLTGTIPSELGNLNSLQHLYLAKNQFTGTIPSEFGNLNSLQHLHLSFNQLTGSIPSAIGNLDSLVSLSLNNNQLTGSIPAALGNLSSLNRLYLNINQLNGSVPLDVAQVGAAAEECSFTNNDPSLCMPGTASYQAIGEDPICGLALDITCDPPVPNLTIDKNKVDFGVVSSGSIKEETVTVTNTGTIDLVIGSVATDNPLEIPFSIVTDSCSEKAVPPSQTCTFIIRSAPTTSGDYSDSFDIPSNYSDTPATVSVHTYCKFPWLMFGPATIGGHQQ